MLSTPIKIKQETTEVTHARVKFEGVLQNLIERADGSLPLDDEITIKDEQDFDRSFEDDIRELEATPVTKSPSKSRKRKKRDFASSDVEQLDDNSKSRSDKSYQQDDSRNVSCPLVRIHANEVWLQTDARLYSYQPLKSLADSFVMKLFDRSVDLASFRPNAPLYPVCRAWMSNSPTAKMPRRDLSPSPEPLPDSDVSENGLIYRLPSPSKTCSEMTEELSRDPRIPSPVPQPEETLDIHADSSQAPSKETLLNGHLQRWRVIRNKWKDASQLNQSRYSESYTILKAMYERQ